MDDIVVDQIIRTARRTIALEITPEAGLIIRAPRRVSESDIDQLIRKKNNWIRTKQEEARRRKDRVVVKKFIEGEEFLFLGSAHRLTLADRLPVRLSFDQEKGFLLFKAFQGHAKNIFRDWYRGQAYQVFTSRTAYYASRCGFQYQTIRISDARTRWGSCSTKQRLCFSWRLVMAPLAIVDYVVIHELAHLKEMNHSKRFWKLVETILPDYRQAERWLKDNRHVLEF